MTFRASDEDARAGQGSTGALAGAIVALGAVGFLCVIVALAPARVLGRISVRALDNRGNFALGGLTVLLAVAVGILAVFLGSS